MPLLIVENDITKMNVDAIVNAANNTLLGGGGVDGAIHRAAGRELYNECMTLGGCETGKAKITGAYKLPCKYVIHTVGPIWNGGSNGEESLLRSCYSESLRLAAENGCESVAFPLISSGAYRYPKDQVLKIAKQSIIGFLDKSDADMTVYIVIFNRAEFQRSRESDAELMTALRDADAPRYSFSLSRRKAEPPKKPPKQKAAFGQSDACFEQMTLCDAPCAGAVGASDLDAALNNIDESFSQMLLRKIDEKGMTDAQCYKKANIDRKLFSKIRTNAAYKPSKATVLAFAVALELNLAEASEMLMKAGYAFSHSNKFDIIVEYFIKKRNYDIFEINQTLFSFDQALLGG